MYVHANLQMAASVAEGLAQADACVIVQSTLSTAVEALLKVDAWHRQHQQRVGRGEETGESISCLQDGLQHLMVLTRVCRGGEVLLRVTINRCNPGQWQRVQFLQSAHALMAELFAQADCAYDALSDRLLAHYSAEQGSSAGGSRVMH